MKASIAQAAAGHTAEGLPLYIFTLCNRHGMEARISTLGGAIAGLRVPGSDGRLADVVCGDMTDGGIHLLPAPGRALHRLAWHAVPLPEEAGVGLRLVSPGPQSVVATYFLHEANVLSLHCESAAPAAVCLCAGFNVAGEGDVAEHLLTVRATRVIPAGAHEQDAAGTPWDCRAPRLVGELPGQARYFLQPGVGAALRLFDPVTARQMEVVTDAGSLRLRPCGESRSLWLETVIAGANGNLSVSFGFGVVSWQATQP